MEGLISKFQFTVSFIGCIVLIAACKKEEAYLPAMTREGRNTMGFMISDSILFGGALEPEDITFDSQSGVLNFQLEKSKRVWSVTRITEFSMELKVDDSGQTFKFKNAHFTDENTVYAADTTGIHFFEVTYFNENRKIVSGNFDLVMVSVDSTILSDTIWLSKGRFDVGFVE